MKRTALIGAASLASAVIALAQRDGETPPEQLTRELSFEIRADRIDDERRTVELTFSSEEPYERWWGTEVLDHSAGSIRLDRLNAGGALLMDHNTRDQIGVVERAWIEGRKGRAIVRFGRSSRAEEIFQDVKDGIRKLVSVGYRIHDLVLERETDGQGTYRATDWEPYEISLVAVPADPTVGVGRDGEPAGYDPRTLLQQEEDDMSATRNAGGGAAPANSPAAPATAAAPATPVTPPAQPEVRAASAPAPAPAAPAPAPEERTAPAGVTATRIRDVVARSNLGADFALELISRNEETPLTEASLTDAIAARLEAQRNTAPINQNRVGDRGIDAPAYRSAVENAIALRAGVAVTLTDAERDNARQFRGMSLIELARQHLEQEGISTRGMDRLELAGVALGMSRAGNHTTSDFAQILSNAANKQLRRAYEAAPQTFAPFTTRGTLPDFKPAPLVGIGDGPALLLVQENGEFKHGTMSDFGDTYKLATYGRIIAITRQVIINDDLNVFSRVPAAFGAQSAQLESDLVYAQLLSNPTMYDGNALFSAAHANLGTAGDINETTLGEAERLMMTQTSPEGTQLNLTPRYLIVGPAKKVEAQKMLSAVTPNATSGVNVFQNSMELIVEARITGNQWYLAADPSLIDTIRLDSLEGQEGVYTETRVGFDVDGVEMKARVDRVAKVVDWRGFVRNAGN